jgi:hypothetical protein
MVQRHSAGRCKKCHSPKKDEPMNLPTPIGLLQEKGVIGEILRQLPRTVLAEAEKQSDAWLWLAKWVKENPVIHWHDGTVAMRDAEYAALEKEGFKWTDAGVYSVDPATRRNAKVYKGVREVRFNYHQHDPKKIIMRVVMDGCWPDSFRKTFVAAASQCEAELRLAEIARGGGSISQSWRLKIRAAQKIGDRKMADHWADKVAGSILQWEHGRQWLLHDKVKGLSAPPKIREIARQKYEKFYAADVRKLGRKPADEKWKGADNLKSPIGFKRDTNSDKIAEAMTTSWLTVGHNGFPGLCFMSDELLAQLLGCTIPLPSLLNEVSDGWKTIRTIRERIGLKKAEILFNGIEKVADKKWAILDLRGEKTHSITLLPDKPLPPKL